MRCPLLSIGDNAFARTHLLSKLHLSNTKFHRIPSAIRNTKTLKTLEIEDGQLTEVTTELQSMFELVNLSLTQNRISSLLSSAFLGDLKLQSIILTSNKLSSLDNKTFDPCPSLQLVKLDKNNLITVDGLFQNPSLMSINLSFNALSTIPENLFNNLENLMVINLEGNFIRSIGNCFAQNYRLEYINLSNNMIKSCNNTFHSLQSLKTIDLRDNSLSSITRNHFSSLPLLEELIISQNNISQIDSEAFSQLEGLKKIDLSRNRLTTLSRESFPRALKIQQIITTGLHAIEEDSLLDPIWILTDSRRSIQYLSAWPRVSDRAGTAILQLLSNLSVKRVIYLQWIPSHVGLYGNEISDSLAKLDTNELLPESLTLTSSEIHSIRKKSVQLVWNSPPVHFWYSGDKWG
ncbi:leucine-rich repeat transmembrane neuronal protein 4-like [Parasteatoda tepidariorum]|uniref:leucine-rich repeat transmembrane neuronal protein 4-like n=1 Tax=Parasteatoda tepidariorum TaxID=114398 RepID=UPI0039BD6736